MTDSGIVGGFLFDRNRAIEQKLGIKIKVVETTDTAIQLALQAARKNGEASPYDLLFVPQDTVSNLAARELIMNIYSVPFFGYDEEYIQTSQLSSLSVNDRAYSVSGDPAFDGAHTYCIFYNKAAFAENDDPMALFANGKWTWEEFLRLAQSSVLDLDDNGRIQRTKDRFGYSSTRNTSSLAYAYFASLGKSFFAPDGEGFPEMSFEIGENDDFVSQMKDICVENDALYPVRNPGEEAVTAFLEGRLSMFCERASYAATFAYAEIDWGIVPMPKKNATSEHSSLIDASAQGFAVPMDTHKSEIAGHVLNAIYAYHHEFNGGDVLKKAYVNYYLRDNSSAVALGRVFDTKRADIAYVYGEGFPDFAMASYDILRNVNEKNVRFEYLYNQNKAPFSAFVRNEFVH